MAKQLNRCETCRFWGYFEDTEQGAKDDPVTLGSCRRNPPFIARDEDTQQDSTGEWPTTLSDEWCGEWQAKEVEPPDLPSDDVTPARNRPAVWLAVLCSAMKEHDYAKAADAQRQLKRLGIVVTFKN